MEWLAIIKLIITVLSAILSALGGSPLFPYTSSQYRLTSDQWQCGDVYWTMAPTVRDKHFTGTVALDCKVQGIGGGGLAGLEKHLLQQVPNIARTIHTGPVKEYLGWLPSTYHELSYDVDSDGDVVEIRGESHIATDKHSELRSLFRSTEIDKQNGAEYLKKFIDELTVVPMGNGWFSVHMKSGSRVEKPWGMSDSEFKNEISRQLEERIESRQEGAVNDVAEHL
ncbi:MAG: smalltalk protein [Bdellovibrionota bacterium]